jgi:hypothetical protein
LEVSKAAAWTSTVMPSAAPSVRPLSMTHWNCGCVLLSMQQRVGLGGRGGEVELAGRGHLAALDDERVLAVLAGEDRLQLATILISHEPIVLSSVPPDAGPPMPSSVRHEASGAAVVGAPSARRRRCRLPAGALGVERDELALGVALERQLGQAAAGELAGEVGGGRALPVGDGQRAGLAGAAVQQEIAWLNGALTRRSW